MSTERFLDGVLPTNDTYFAFDGTNSDLARQLYLRAKAGDSVSPFVNFVVPRIIQDRLNSLSLEWKQLSGIAQRALLWDSGFSVTVNNEPVQIWPLSGHSMTDLAIPLLQFQDIGCVEMNCTEPDNTTSWSNMFCNGDQMRNVSRCVTAKFEDPHEIHLPMWASGGKPDVIPTPRVRMHKWNDVGSNISYTVVAVHTVEQEEEPAYGFCATPKQNSGYGSLVFTCYELDDSDAIYNQRQEVQGSPWVSRWLIEDFSTKSRTTASTFTEERDGMKLVSIVPIVAGILAIVVMMALFVYKRQKNIEANAIGDLLIYQEPGRSQNIVERKLSIDRFTSDQSSAPALDDAVSVPDKENGKTIKWNRTVSSMNDKDSGSIHTFHILHESEFLASKRIPYECLVFRKALSKGASGEVWLGEYRNQEFAFKRLLQGKAQQADEVKSFAQEIDLTASLIHPNIVSFVGVAWNSLSNLVMVLEFFPRGDLQCYLAKNADLLSWPRDKICIAVGVGCALEYLHSKCPSLIHRDLKSKNIMLTDQLEPKLIDFGVSRTRQEHSMTAGVGTPYWTAPEVLEGKRYTELADIYSLGVVLSELDTGKIPYHDVVAANGKKLRPFQILTEVMAGMLRPSFSSECPPRIRRIGVACWQHDPSRRPTAAQVRRMLEEAD